MNEKVVFDDIDQPNCWSAILATSHCVYLAERFGHIYKFNGYNNELFCVTQNSPERGWTGLTLFNGDVYACEFGGHIYKLSMDTGGLEKMDFMKQNWTGLSGSAKQLYGCDRHGRVFLLIDFK